MGARLSLAMIVKDEEAMLGEALDSVAGMVDEMVIVDTGSTDRTIEIARERGAIVREFPWCGDFSAARNVSLEACTGDWILVLDADERMCGASRELVDQLPPIDESLIRCFALARIDMTRSGQRQGLTEIVRVLPNTPGLRYTGLIHETVTNLADPRPMQIARITGPHLIHYGYDPKVYEKREKHALSLGLIQKTLESDPNDIGMLYYLGRAFRHERDLDRAQEAFRSAIEAHGPDHRETYLRLSYRDLVRCLIDAKTDKEEVLTVVRDALRRCPRSADLWLQAAEVLGSADEHELAEQAFGMTHQCLGDDQEDLTDDDWVRSNPIELYRKWSEAFHRRGLFGDEFSVLELGLVRVRPGMPGWENHIYRGLLAGLSWVQQHGFGEIPIERFEPFLTVLLSRADAPLEPYHQYLALLTAHGVDASVERDRWTQRFPRSAS